MITLFLVPGMCSPVNSKCTLMTKIFEALSQNLSCNNALVNGMVNCVFDSRHEHYDIFQVYHWSIEVVPTLSQLYFNLELISDYVFDSDKQIGMSNFLFAKPTAKLFHIIIFIITVIDYFCKSTVMHVNNIQA